MKESCQHIPSDQPLSYGQGETSNAGIDNNNYKNEPNISSQPALVSQHQVSIPHPLNQSPYNPSHDESADAQISFKTQPQYHDDQMQTTKQNVSFSTGTTIY